jgi:hypothetical protein
MEYDPATTDAERAEWEAPPLWGVRRFCTLVVVFRAFAGADYPGEGVLVWSTCFRGWCPQSIT